MLPFGDRTFRVKPRTMKRDREWMDSVLSRVIQRLTVLDGDKLRTSDIIAALGNASDDMLDLILEYDETGQLPPREWFDEHSYTTQTLDAFTTLLEVAYPPFRVSRRLLPADRAAAIIGKLLDWALDKALGPQTESAQSEPTNSPSPSGDTEPPKKSRKASPAGSSGS